MRPAAVSTDVCAEISEIFSSLQGEGPYLGTRQIFVRMGRCNLHCVYCDETQKMKPERFKIYSRRELLERIAALEAQSPGHSWVSLTGGEPLFYASFLEKAMPMIRRAGFRTYLETNGTLPRELGRVIDFCDVVAMDFKPPSSSGDRDFMKEHRDFLKKAVQKNVFVKVVVTPSTKTEEILECARAVSEVDARIPFILQPVSDAFGIQTDSLKLIEHSLFGALSHFTTLTDIRVIPQVHKIWGVR